MEFKYNVKEGALSVTPEYHHFDSGSEKLLTLKIANEFATEVDPEVSLYDPSGHFRIVDVANGGIGNSGGTKGGFLASIEFNPLRGCLNYMYDEETDVNLAEMMHQDSTSSSLSGYDSPWCALLPPVASLMDQFIDEGPVHEFEYGIWFIWRAKILKRVDNSFWNTLRAEAHITVSTKLGYSNIVRMVGDAPKINLSPKKYINFGTVGISQTQKIMVELFNPTQHTVEVEIVGGIPAGSACANYIEENLESFNGDANGTDWLDAAKHAVGIKCSKNMFSLDDDDHIQPVLSDHDNSVKKGAGVFRLNGKKRSMKLGPQQKGKLGPIVFRPRRQGEYRSTVYIRSLLGGLEAVTLVGRGNIGRLAFVSASEVISIRGTHEANVEHESSKAGQHGIKDIDPKLLKKYVTKIWNKETSYLSSKPLSKGNRAEHNIRPIPIVVEPAKLHFQYDHYMKVGVDDDKRDNNTLFATNRKDMLIVNVGEVPIKVFSYRLGSSCNKNGFSLLNCEDDAIQDAFVLKPYDFHAFEIEYRSDCAASYSTAHLNIEAALGVQIKRKNHLLTLPIRASVAWAILPACAEAYVLSAYGEPKVIVKCALLMALAYVLLEIRKGINRFNKTSMPLVYIPKISPAKSQTKNMAKRVETEEQEGPSSADPKTKDSIDTNEIKSDEMASQNSDVRVKLMV